MKELIRQSTHVHTNGSMLTSSPAVLEKKGLCQQDIYGLLRCTWIQDSMKGEQRQILG